MHVKGNEREVSLSKNETSALRGNILAKPSMEFGEIYNLNDTIKRTSGNISAIQWKLGTLIPHTLLKTVIMAVII